MNTRAIYKPKPMPDRSDVSNLQNFLDYEDGLMDSDERIEFLQALVSTGTIYQLQGFYGRDAHREGLL